MFSNKKELKIFRIGDLSLKKKKGISFYTIKLEDLKSYKNNFTDYYSWILPINITERIVNLHSKESIKAIIDYYDKNKNSEDIKSHFSNYEMRIDNPELNTEIIINGKNELIRHSDNPDDDRKMASILKKIFPNSLGSFTLNGKGLTHSEIIIWDYNLNVSLHYQKEYNYTKQLYNIMVPPKINKRRRQYYLQQKDDSPCSRIKQKKLLY